MVNFIILYIVVEWYPENITFQKFSLFHKLWHFWPIWEKLDPNCHKCIKQNIFKNMNEKSCRKSINITFLKIFLKYDNFFLFDIVKQFTGSHEFLNRITKINREINIVKDIYDY